MPEKGPKTPERFWHMLLFLVHPVVNVWTFYFYHRWQQVLIDFCAEFLMGNLLFCNILYLLHA